MGGYMQVHHVQQDACPIFVSEETRSSVLIAAALAAKWMEPAKDALDTMVLGKYIK